MHFTSTVAFSSAIPLLLVMLWADVRCNRARYVFLDGVFWWSSSFGTFNDQRGIVCSCVHTCLMRHRRAMKVALLQDDAGILVLCIWGFRWQFIGA